MMKAKLCSSSEQLTAGCSSVYPVCFHIGNMKKHMMKAHLKCCVLPESNSQCEVIQCNQCDFIFIFATFIKKQLTVGSNCNQCDFILPIGNTKKHMMKAIQCNQCDFIFYIGNIKKHMMKAHFKSCVLLARSSQCEAIQATDIG